MPDERTRLTLAKLAARLMYDRQENEYFHAKRKAARHLGLLSLSPGDLPSNREIRDQIRVLSQFFDGEAATIDLQEMRCDALRMMRLLKPSRPSLIGSVLSGHIRRGSDIDIHVFAKHSSSLTDHLDHHQFDYQIERKSVRKNSEQRTFTHIHIEHRFPVELSVYPLEKIGHKFKSSITGRAIESATLPQFEAIMTREYPELDLDALPFSDETIEHDYALFERLLIPLEHVKQDPRFHPEGDALYHSLQVFEIVRDERSYDQELILAALLHDVGKAIDRSHHVEAGLAALEGSITARTEFLIRRHMDFHRLMDGEASGRAALRLRRHEFFDDLCILGPNPTGTSRRDLPARAALGSSQLQFVRGRSGLSACRASSSEKTRFSVTKCSFHFMSSSSAEPALRIVYVGFVGY